MIADGRTITGGHLDRWIAGPHVRAAAARFGEPGPLDDPSPAPPLRARVYQGMWIVDCPCGGAEMVWRSHALVWCCSCGNRYLGGAWRGVELPPNRDEIEAALAVRPFPVNQNWMPGESLADLLRENEEAGL